MPDSLPPAFPETLARLIAAGGFASALAFSRASGIPPQTLSNLLSGQRKPRWDTVQRIAAALGITTDSLRDPAP